LKTNTQRKAAESGRIPPPAVTESGAVTQCGPFALALASTLAEPDAETPLGLALAEPDALPLAPASTLVLRTLSAVLLAALRV
jgi:hypothetical protein